MFLPTTCITTSNATVAATPLGDEVETWAMVDSDIPAHLAEQRRLTTEPGTGVVREVRYIRLLCPPGTVLTDGMRVQDQTDDHVYVVVHVEDLPRRSPVGYEMVTADLERVA